MITMQQMALAALKWRNKPRTVNNVYSLVIWASFTKKHGTWNPWELDGDFATITDGLEAFWKQLEDFDYRPIIAALDNSDAPAVTCTLICDSKWGSKPTSTIQGEVLNDWA